MPYADVFQPVVIALERYLDYPPVGAIGAGEEQAKKSTRKKHQRIWSFEMLVLKGKKIKITTI